ncbi:MAG: GIY-YIG nuclease family protein [Candidatus Bathyarchaeota archaeon]|jgi:Uri superfamily endonuclease
MNIGAYCLCILVSKTIEVKIGALGGIGFTDGRYVYVGSAMNGLEARVKRHIETSVGRYRALHWHVDYLLKEDSVGIESVYMITTDERIECDLANSVSKMGDPIPDFGCSDCRCESHLFRVDDCSFLSDLGLTQRSLDNNP